MAEPLAPIGILGGTFDPVHLGHLRMAEELAEALGCVQVRLLPTGTPPHRAPPQASPAQRLAMVELAAADNPRFAVDGHEIGKTAPCYMVDTLTALRAELGAAQPVVLFLGGDAFLGLDTWHDWTRLFELAHLAVAHRPGFTPEQWQARLPQAIGAQLRQRQAHAARELAQSPAGRIWLQPVTQLDIAASRLRQRLRAGQSIRYLVPEAVHAYIQHHHLYR